MTKLGKDLQAGDITKINHPFIAEETLEAAVVELEDDKYFITRMPENFFKIFPNTEYEVGDKTWI